MRTLKKSLIGSAAVALLGTFVFGRDVVSYAYTGFNNVRNAVKSEVPIEFEVDRARALVGQLVPDIRECMLLIAEQQVDVESRQLTLAEKEASLAKQKDAILTMQADLASGESSFVYAGNSYTSDEVKRDLTNRFERYKAAEGTLSADRKVMEARRQTLVANTQRLSDLNQAKMDLEVKIEQLQARVQTVSAAETVSLLAFDDSSLSHASKLIDDLNKQLDVKERMLDAEVKFADLIPVENVRPEASADISQQIDAHFGRSANSTTVAKTE